jgi:hypothetical protein
MYIRALGRGLLLLNSQRVAIDLLEKRSSIYSSRPHYISAGDYMTQDLSFGFTQNNDLCILTFLFTPSHTNLSPDCAVSGAPP